MEVGKKDIGKIGNKKVRVRERVAYFCCHGLVDGTPPDIVLRGVFLDDTLIRGRTASLSTRVGGESTAGGDSSTGFVDEGIFVESRDRRVGNLVSLARCLGV